VAMLVLAPMVAFGEGSQLTEASGAFSVLKSARVARGSAVERPWLWPQVEAMRLSRGAARTRRVRDEIRGFWRRSKTQLAVVSISIE
jgi:hypothetical protein